MPHLFLSTILALLQSSGTLSGTAQDDEGRPLAGVLVVVSARDARPDAVTPSGKSDGGVQLSFQRFLRKQAFYAPASAVYFSGSDNRVTPDLEKVVPTVVLGWERRLTRHTNGILQLYSSPSVVSDSTLDELTAEKYLLSAGLQSHRGGWFYRVALTENLKSFSNTPDIGLTFSVARVAFGR